MHKINYTQLNDLPQSLAMRIILENKLSIINK